MKHVRAHQAYGILKSVQGSASSDYVFCPCVSAFGVIKALIYSLPEKWLQLSQISLTDEDSILRWSLAEIERVILVSVSSAIPEIVDRFRRRFRDAWSSCHDQPCQTRRLHPVEQTSWHDQNWWRHVHVHTDIQRDEQRDISLDDRCYT